jgi:hypothetical protein
MGITWFFAILWKRCNRWGAMASFFAALAAAGAAKFILNWEGDAGCRTRLCCTCAAGSPPA